MKRILTLCAMAAGAFAVMVGTSSCKDKEECCEWTDDYGDDYRYCEDDDIVQGYEWSQVVAYANSYGGDCD